MRQSLVIGLGTLAGAVACSAAAQAADLPLRSAPPVFTAAPVISIDDWSGVYAGSTYGYGFNTFHARQTGSTTVPGAVGNAHSTDANGQTGGALIGYRLQSGRFVYGAEGSIDLNVIRRKNDPAGTAIVPAVDDSLYDIRLRGMLGYEFGRFMPFVAGGAVINETYQYGTSDGVAGGEVPNYFGRNRQSVGWTVGGGLEYKFHPQELIPGLPSWIAGPMILRAEYMYQSLPSETFAYAGQSYRTKSDGSFVRGAIIYRLGDNPARSDISSLGEVNWAGGYGGILGGYGDFSTRTRAPGGATTNSIGGSGGLGGIYAGSNFMFGHYMLGFDGSTSYSDFTGHGTLPGGDRVDYRSYIQADIRGRAGYAFGRFLPFVAAGVAFSRSEQVDTDTGSRRGRVPPDAFTLGGGLDYRLAEHVSLRVEDLYEFNSWKNNVEIGNTGSVATGTIFNQKRNGNIVRAGLAYHFE